MLDTGDISRNLISDCDQQSTTTTTTTTTAAAAATRPIAD